MTILFFLLGIVCLAIRESLNHFNGITVWSDLPNGHFFGRLSWTRKYKPYTLENYRGQLFVSAPDNWYYRFFNIQYKERFPLSATLLSCFTDGFHLMQWLAINFLTLAIAFSLGDVIISFIWLRLTAALLWWFIFEVILKKRK
jgi:hypothetical protein